MNAQGTLLGRTWYGGWGTVANGALPTPFAFGGRSGAYTDAETGLIRMGARYYAPALGRFISRDPSGFASGPNLYAYCLGDPVNFFDPTGSAPVPQWVRNLAGGIDRFEAASSAAQAAGRRSTVRAYDASRQPARARPDISDSLWQRRSAGRNGLARMLRLCGRQRHNSREPGTFWAPCCSYALCRLDAARARVIPSGGCSSVGRF